MLTGIGNRMASGLLPHDNDLSRVIATTATPVPSSFGASSSREVLSLDVKQASGHFNSGAREDHPSPLKHAGAVCRRQGVPFEYQVMILRGEPIAWVDDEPPLVGEENPVIR
jgi:hypothetical protein